MSIVRPRTVAEVMRRSVVTVDPDASLAELTGLLRTWQLSGVPVTDRQGRALGTVGVTEVLCLAERITAGHRRGNGSDPWDILEAVTVRNLMIPEVQGVGPDWRMEELLAFFGRTGVHRALVLDAGRLVGIVSMSDLLEMMPDGPDAPRPDGAPRRIQVPLRRRSRARSGTSADPRGSSAPGPAAP